MQLTEYQLNKCDLTDKLLQELNLEKGTDYIISMFKVTEITSTLLETYIRIQFKYDDTIVNRLKEIGWIYEKTFWKRNLKTSVLYEGHNTPKDGTYKIARMRLS